MILLFLAGGIPFVLGIWIPSLSGVGYVYNGLILAAALADLMLTPRQKEIRVSREVSEVLSVGAENPVLLRVKNRARLPIEVELMDEPPIPNEIRGLPVTLKLLSHKEKIVRYHVEPKNRGHGRFEAVHLRYPSVFKLWNIHHRRILEQEVRIYPDIRAVARFDLLAVRNRLDEVGYKFFRIRGRGGDFERLREYRRGDEPRDIDWKATAKHERLISREFTVERNQNVMVVLDCGRSMLHEAEGLSHLDRGLNAAVFLSYIALGQGDNVGFMAFSNQIERYLSPVRGKPAIQSVLRNSYDLKPKRVASDYGLVCEEILRRQRKRALLILVTHTLDEQHLVAMERYVRTLTRNHLLLLVFLRDVSLSEMASKVPEHDIEAFQIAAAGELLKNQAQKIAELKESGVLILETLPDRLSADLINEYLALKAQHLL